MVNFVITTTFTIIDTLAVSDNGELKMRTVTNMKHNEKLSKLGILHSPKGMTLIELLVVVSIMVSLVAISVPLFKPMLESQRTAGSARAVAMTLQRARVKAMQEQRAYGVEFVRYREGDNDNMCLQMRLQKEAPKLVQIGGSDKFRLRIVNGTLKFCVYDASNGWIDEDSYGSDQRIIDAKSAWNQKVKPGFAVQFIRLGRTFYLDSSSNVRLASPYNNFYYPSNNSVPSASASEFTVIQPPRATLTYPVTLPHGTVVDLQYSSFRNPSDNSSSESFRYGSFFSAGGNPANVTVLFSPTGYVDRFYYNDASRGYCEISPHGGLFYFLVGEWDRQSTDMTGANLAEDGRNNVMMPSNFWVTVHPQNGQVRITENNPTSNADIQTWKNAGTPALKKQALDTIMENARKFATEHYVNIGGF